MILNTVQVSIYLRVVVEILCLGHRQYKFPVRMSCWDFDVRELLSLVLSWRRKMEDFVITVGVTIHLGIVKFPLNLKDSHLLCLFKTSLNFAHRHH